MQAASPRQAAFTILRRVDREGAFSSLLLQHLDAGSFDPRDLALVTELVYGVLRRRLYLDHVIAAFSRRPFNEIEADLRLVLQLALYQILFLERIPAHAAVNEAARMARRRMRGRGASAAAFVNGLLRAVTRERARVPPPPTAAAAEDPAAALAIAESHPRWLARRWIDRFGLQEASALLAAQNRRAPLALRVNRRLSTPQSVTLSLAAESVVTRPSRFLDEFLIAVEGAPQRTDSFRRGEFYIQDEASGLVALLAGARPGAWVLDACAAPGGKALAMADMVGERGLVVAGDLHPSRLRLVGENARRLGLPWCVTLAGDFAAAPPPIAEGIVFDAVVVDAPCSGTGVIRRNPELRYRLAADDLERLVSLQARLLSVCAGLVRPGGALVYSVCSLEPEEGPARVSRFLEENPGFALEDPGPLLPERARGLVAPASEGPVLITLPHRHDLDGFFAARIRRQR